MGRAYRGPCYFRRAWRRPTPHGRRSSKGSSRFASARHVHRRHRHERLPSSPLGDRRQLVDEAINGYAEDQGLARQGGRAIAGRPTTAAASPSTSTPSTRRARSSSSSRCCTPAASSARTTPLGRPPRRRRLRRQRALEELIATVKRDGSDYEQTYSRGKPTTKLKKWRRHRGKGTTITSGRTPHDLRRPSQFDAEDPRAPRGQDVPPSRPARRVPRRDREAGRRDEFTHPGGIAGVPREARHRARQGRATARSTSRARASNGSSSRCMDRSDRRAVRSYVNGIPTPSGRHARERLLRASTRPCATTWRRTTWSRRAYVTAEDIREGIVGAAVGVRPGAAVPGPDEGSPQQPRGRGAVDSVVPSGAGEVAEREPHARRGDRRPHRPGGACARGEPRGGRRRSRARRPSPPAEPARQARRLLVDRPSRRASSSSSRATPPAAPRSRGATDASRRSSRCAARS